MHLISHNNTSLLSPCYLAVPRHRALSDHLWGHSWPSSALKISAGWLFALCFSISAHQMIIRRTGCNKYSDSGTLPDPLCSGKWCLKSVPGCSLAEEAYRSLGMSLAERKSPSAISTHAKSSYCPSYLFPLSKGYWCSGGRRPNSKTRTPNSKNWLKRSNRSSKLCAVAQLKIAICNLLQNNKLELKCLWPVVACGLTKPSIGWFL